MPADRPHRGLGLEIARSLAAANGGSIEFAPREGGGTAARVDVPAAMMEAETP
jgi:signal transduction histidine kinase